MLATRESVRSAGALTDSTISGKVNDTQIDTAITFAVSKMREVQSDYDDTAIGSEEEKKSDYMLAESLFAVSALPRVLTSVQLAQTGLVSVIERGEEKRTIGDKEEEKKIQEYFEREAMNILAKYRSADWVSNGKIIGVKSKRSKFSITSI
jgi:hypothetical protein